METIRHSDELLEVKINEKEFKIIWVSDLHYDSKYSQWKHLKKYLDNNPETYIVIGGDSVDVMQIVKDFRGSKSATKTEHNEDNYVNLIINDLKENIVEPYKHRIISWNRGNHDNSVTRHHNVDLLQLICGIDIHVHEFNGYIVVNSKFKNKTTSRLIHFSHAPEAGGTRSKGSLSIDLAKAEYPSADIWVREHIHNGFIHPVRQEFFNHQNRTIAHLNKWYVQNIAVKQESQGKRNGFHYETMKGNRVSGFVEFSFTHNRDYSLICSRVNHILFD